jgi:hypothetical protein
MVAERRSNSKDPQNTLRLVAGLTRCSGAVCEDLSKLKLGPLALEEEVTLQMKWNEEKKEVRFQRIGAAAKVARYTQSVDTVLPSKTLVVLGDAANCTVGDRPSTFMSVVFDNVSTMQ